MVTLEAIHRHKIIWTEYVVFRKKSVYAHIFIHMQYQIVKKKKVTMDFKERGKGTWESL